ncbi:MAG TPA: dehydrogenase E1 component subunit alpha/beta [Candidatus Polarisedimenticolia bacterium]|nr:dehydrogenase E1 component subunit alpha/beta [Candidatus Polarisedimenticolia bacterium]
MAKRMEQKITPIRSREREVPADLLVDLYKKMLQVYYLEERIKVFVRAGKVSFHASTRGHEKVQIAMSYLLQPGKDWFFPYYREKALMLGLGMPLKDIFLHMLSKADDPSGGGRNMSEHFSSRDLRVVSPTACTGTQFLPAVGMARAIKADGRDEIVYVSSGEGATSEGEFFEALNWAVREQLPVLFVIQNNGYAISVPQEVQTGSEVEDISRGFHMRALHVDGTRFTDMHNDLKPLIAEMRNGGGPRLIEAHVVRLDSHSSSDDQSKYRSQEELDAIVKEDPLAHTAGVLLNKKILKEDDIKRLHEEVRAKVEQAARAAEDSADPAPETAVQHILSGRMPVTSETAPRRTSPEPVTMVEAINRGLREEMARNPKIIMWGEDVADPKGGVFGVTRGLGTAFPGRVTNSPLAEASIVGVAQGMAIGGYRPVVEIQFGDYSFPGYMQMRNEIPTLRWRSGGAWSCPMVVRIAVGGYIRGGPFHSQCIEALYAHTPGWCIAYPSNAADAKGLIKTACRMEDPVLFLEHKGLYRQVYSKAPEPDAEWLLPFGKARIARRGTDVTAVTWGSGVVRCERAADALREEGISVEVIDLRTIMPWDAETVLESAARTGKAIVVHEAIMTGGFGGEVASRIASDVFDHLDGPVRRVAAKDSFVAYAPVLESYVLPTQDEVTTAIRDLARY